ncbi:MAG TPA: hypothetical protein VKG24_09545, partial [Pseudolabrys sp.]|nr:hypothetical protein [Pseudolabrys sp.]
LLSMAADSTVGYRDIQDRRLRSGLPIVAQVLLNDLRYAFVILGNSRHDLFGFGMLHLVSKRAHLFRSVSPEFWILQIGRGHRSTVT